MENIAQKTEQYLREHAEELFADLARIVSYPSVKSAPQPGAPMGPAVAECLDACAALYRENGFDAEVFQESAYALAYSGAKPAEGKYTGVFTHADVVPVTPEDWILTSPFQMKDTGDLVIGRGVDDDKHAVVGALWILRAIRDLGIPLAHPITVFIGGNEEAGMKDIRSFKREHADCLPAVSVVPDGNFPVSFGERGGFHADILADTPFRDVLSLEGGNAYNIVLGKLSCRVRALPGLAAYLADAGCDWLNVAAKDEELELTVSGVPSHGSRPQYGESALFRLCRLLSGFAGFCDGDRATFTQAAAMLENVYGVPFGIENDDPYMGKLTCANGIAKLTDGKLLFTQDIRFGPGVDKERTKEILEASVRARGFSVTTTKGGTSFRIDPESAPAKAFIEAYRKYSNRPDAQPFFMSGGTYSKVLFPESPSFSTGVSFGKYIDRLHLPAGHGSCHESDECLGKQEYIRGLSILCGILCELDATY